MFTGIITDLGKVRAVVAGPVTKLKIDTSFDTAMIDLGASVARASARVSAEKAQSGLPIAPATTR